MSLRLFVVALAAFCGVQTAAAQEDPARARLIAALDGLAEASGDAERVEGVANKAANDGDAEHDAKVAETPAVAATAHDGAGVAGPVARPTRKTPLGTLTDRDVEGAGRNGWLAVGVALFALTGVAWWLKRSASKSVKVKGLAIETLASARVSGKHAVSVVRVGGRVLVVGQSEHGLTLLTELADDEVPTTSRSSAKPETLSVETGAGSFVERVSRMRAGFKAPGKGDGKGGAYPTDPFHAALMKDAPVDELAKLDERAQIRERLEALRRRSLSVA